MNHRLLPAALVLILAGQSGCTDPAAPATYRDVEVDTMVEEQRLPRLRTAHPDIDFEELAATGVDALGTLGPDAAGHLLWQLAVRAVQTGARDDRPLYWARLAARASLGDRSTDAAAFEWSSRGMDDVTFHSPSAHRILITGFDPFGLDTHLDQSNPSGLAVLALDGTVLETRRGSAEVQGVLIPVRFVDFDSGLIETFLAPLLEAEQVDLVITLSMGREGFDLERFPGRRRSAEVPDNLNVLTGASPESPLIPGLNGEALDGPEYVEFSLPATAMQQVEGPFPIRDNRTVRTVEQGELLARDLEMLRGLTAVTGSGGGYLSNEISYRSLLLNRQMRESRPMGHLHTPRVAGYDRTAEWRMVEQIRRMLVAAVEALPAQ